MSERLQPVTSLPPRDAHCNNSVMVGRLGACSAAVAAAGVAYALLRRTGGRLPVRVVPRGKPLVTEPRPRSLSIVSWNLLSQRWSTPQRLRDVYPQYLEWEHRWPLLQRELAGFGPVDVVCVQEVSVER